jgi:hypothetical protein
VRCARADLAALATKPATWRAFLFVDLVKFFRLKFSLPGQVGRGNNLESEKAHDKNF